MSIPVGEVLLSKGISLFTLFAGLRPAKVRSLGLSVASQLTVIVMAERMSTATRMDRARANGKVTRMENGHLKRKERANRDKRMAELIAKGQFPYIPSVMSWVSEKLGKPATQVTEAEAKALGQK